jgi:hypothetical protein
MSDMKISITLDAAQLKRELGLTQDELKKIDGKQVDVKTDSAKGSIASLRDSLAMWGLAVSAAIAAAKGLASAINSVVAPALVQEKAEKDLAAAMKNTGVYSAQLEAQLKAQASAIQSVTTYGDESILMATRQMQVIGRLSADQLPAAQKAAVGLAAAYGLDLNTAFEMVGKAAAGNTATLSRYGIVLKEGLSAAEKFDEVLRIGADGFGLAEAAANNTSGALQQLKNLWGDLKEMLGNYVLPILGDVSAAFSDILKFMQGVSSNEKAAAKQTQELADKFDFLTGRVLSYKEQTSLTAIEQEEFNGYIKELNQEFPDMFEGMDIMSAKYDDVAVAIANARAEVELLMDRMVLQAVMDDYSKDILKQGKKIRKAQEELAKYTKMQDEGKQWVVVGPDKIRSVQSYINFYNEIIEGVRKKKAEIIEERDAVAAELGVLPEPKPRLVTDKGTGSGAGSGSGSGTAAATKAEISETAKAYEQLIGNLRKYHSDVALEKLSAHQRALAELDQQFQAQQAVVLASMSAQEITEAEGQSRLLEIRGKFDAQAAQVQKKADDEIIALAQKRIEQAVRDEESYYETMKFADEGYYEWKLQQIRNEVEAMAIGDAAKLELVKKYIADLDALKEETTTTDTKKQGSWFFSGLLGFDPDSSEDQTKIQAMQDTYRNIASQASSITGGLMRLSQQRRDQEIADLEAKAAKEGMTNDQLLAQKEAITQKYAAEEKKLKNIQKAMSIGQAVINTAEGATKALAMGPIIGPIMAAFITALGAAQVGIIQAQKFASGGLFRGKGGPRDDQNLAYISDGEYIINAAATKRFKPILDAINFGQSVSAVPKLAYADGGMVSGGMDMGKKLDQVINKLEILNLNLVKKKLAVTVQTPGTGSSVRELDSTRKRMEERGYDPNFA